MSRVVESDSWLGYGLCYICFYSKDENPRVPDCVPSIQVLRSGRQIPETGALIERPNVEMFKFSKRKSIYPNMRGQRFEDECCTGRRT